MKYETTPIPVEAHQQQLVSAHVPVAPQTIDTANPGDWIVKWPDGRLEVFTDAAFRAKFRPPPRSASPTPPPRTSCPSRAAPASRSPTSRPTTPFAATSERSRSERSTP